MVLEYRCKLGYEGHDQSENYPFKFLRCYLISKKQYKQDNTEIFTEVNVSNLIPFVLIISQHFTVN